MAVMATVDEISLGGFGSGGYETADLIKKVGVLMGNEGISNSAHRLVANYSGQEAGAEGKSPDQIGANIPSQGTSQHI